MTPWHCTAAPWKMMVGAFSMMMLAAATQSDQHLLLAVVINNYATGKIGEFVLREGALFATGEELRDLGFISPPSSAAAKENLIKLDGLTEFSYRIDQGTETLYVTAGASRLKPALLGPPALRGSDFTIESGTGATFNYDLIGTSVDGRQQANGAFDVRGFSPWGVVSSGVLAFAGPGSNGSNSGGVNAIRLDSTYVYSDPQTLRRYRAGDFISGFLSWTRPVRLGGLQVTSDFSMRPDLITFPAPSVSGTVAVPSTVDVLVNGNRVLSQQVQPGPFQVPQLPVITGAGTVSMTVTNALGQQIAVEQPFYASSSLLAPDLQTYSVETGFVRRNWSILSNDYGSFAGAATYRRGLTDDLTLEGHAEATDGLFMAGAGGVVNIANLAVANLGIAGSTGPGYEGAQLSAGIQHLDPLFSAGVSAILATRNFGDIAAVNGDPIARFQVAANIGFSLGRFGSLGIAYTGIERADQPSPVLVAAQPGNVLAPGPNGFFVPTEQQSHILHASYSAQLGNLFGDQGNASFYVTAFHDFSNHNDIAVSVGFVVPLDARSSGGLSAQSDSGTQSAQLQANQTASEVGDWGYSGLLSAQREDSGAGGNPSDVSGHEFAEVSYKSPWGLAFAGVDHLSDQTTLQAEARGAVSIADHAVFVSNQIIDSFAIVDTGGFEGIAVRQENRYAGKTDAAGQLLVPDLRSFEINHLSIDPLNAPIDAAVPFSKYEVRPQDRSGVVVQFPLKLTHGALLRLTGADGKPIPVDSTATLVSTGVTVPVGYDGEAYLVDVQPHNQLRVELPNGGHCAVDFDYRPASGEIPIIGPLQCREAKQ
jgi:outer membrane usher protein